MTRLTASEVARNFSAILNRVAAGEEIEVTRAGAPVAVIAPSRPRLLSAVRFRELMASAPPVDDEFAEDLRLIRRESGDVPESAWPS
ncbi:MAG TPA: type II toxin-antitoxin system prevent-host-death family antitoxin [Gaiellaceae bacterium]|nr:type II toxin-antitoxin system prevent-host-death family antitoxin [Gaiellaceae bacterium]